jgi:phospholipid/cholesterol/gamma-HCH transport system substrate-binding protein
MTETRSFFRGWAGVGGGILAAALVIGLLLVAWPSGGSKTGTAYFTKTVHLYPGSDVVVLGVKGGSVTSVEPQGDQVRVKFTYKSSLKVPADAHAVIVEPTIVADRVMQLAPAYGGGDVLADGATIPTQRTGIPVELDEFNRNVTELAKALGPDGANSNGSLSRLVEVGADNLRGNGQAGNDTITNVSAMLGTLGDNREALFATVRNLQGLVKTLNAHDAETKRFSRDLADVSRFLSAQREDFGKAVHALGTSLDDVSRFISDNRAGLAANIKSLTSVTKVLNEERFTLAHTLDAGAVGITNYPHMYSPAARTYNSRFVGNSVTDNPALFICQLLQAVGAPPQKCLDILSSLDTVKLPSTMDPTLGGILPGGAR